VTTTTGVIEHWLALHKEQKLWSWGTQPPLMAAFYRNFHMLDSSWNVRHFGTPSHFLRFRSFSSLFC